MITHLKGWFLNSTNCIVTDDLLLLTSRGGSPTAVDGSSCVRPFDRFGDKWLAEVPIPGGMCIVQLLGFVTRRTFRAVSGDTGSSRFSIVTYSLSEDCKAVTVDASEHLVSVDNLPEAPVAFGRYYEHVDPPVLVMIMPSSAYASSVHYVLYEIRGQRAYEKVRVLSEHSMMCYDFAHRKLLYCVLDSTSARHSLFSLDVDTNERRVLKTWRDRLMVEFDDNGRLIAIEPDQDGRWGRFVSVYDGGSWTNEQPSRYTVDLGIDCWNWCALLRVPAGMALMPWERHVAMPTLLRLWTDPPTLSELALSRIQKSLSDRARERLERTAAPVGFSGFVRLVCGEDLG